MVVRGILSCRDMALTMMVVREIERVEDTYSSCRPNATASGSGCRRGSGPSPTHDIGGTQASSACVGIEPEQLTVSNDADRLGE